MKPIRFGTDGWRGVIADDFTFERVAAVCTAIGAHLRADGRADAGVAIGYDNRFASPDFAELAATILTRQGIRVVLADRSVPTPAVSFTIQDRRLGGGVVVTASHNPARYNGIKFKPWYAGSASEDDTKDLVERANVLLPTTDLDALRAPGPDPALLTRADLIPAYLQRLYTFIDRDAIRAAAPRLLVETLYGASAGVLDRALRECGCDVAVLHDECNPGFGGLNPEPVPEQLAAMFATVRAGQFAGALASDGDGDRLSAATEDGTYLSPHHVFALLLIHLVEDRGLSGGVVKTVSTTTMINQLVTRYHLPLYETPIGFKYICQLMLEHDILIGGEESGGIGVRGHIPERDATLAALLLIDMMAAHRTTLGGLLQLLRERVGDHAYDRIDVALEQTATREQFAAIRRELPPRLDGAPVRDVSEKDGIKVWLDDGSWLLLRASGTEPVLRVYAESDTPERVQQLLRQGRALVAASGIREAVR